MTNAALVHAPTVRPPPPHPLCVSVCKGREEDRQKRDSSLFPITLADRNRLFCACCHKLRLPPVQPASPPGSHSHLPSFTPPLMDPFIQKKLVCSKATDNTCSKSLLCDHKSRFDELEREIRAEFQNLHRFLDEEECKDLERLRRERQKQLKQLKEREKKIAEQGKDLERAITVLDNKLAEEDSPKLLKEIQDLIKRSQVSFVPPPEVDTEVRSGQFVGPIQYRIWKHMKRCLYPNITSMTFDPETAHPSLSLSQSCTSVWFEDDKDTKDIQASPRRFHFYYCVLGHQGFTTGRHYWEVEHYDVTFGLLINILAVLALL
ncbi:putative zinc-binding protein A33-like [Scophthalmus maximus]|uniref:Putative zinc-binding protein A33-like n=1 Tax=Scophthalmus maximus TaxID=52904 RepID=A0A2U9AXI0_SCOMX|nr:putative zinc-binding protein A33-like [Scophthalmus maximus]